MLKKKLTPEKQFKLIMFSLLEKNWSPMFV